MSKQEIEETICDATYGNPLKYIKIAEWIFRIRPRGIIFTHADSFFKPLGKFIVDYCLIYNIPLIVNDRDERKLKPYRKVGGIIVIPGNILLASTYKEITKAIVFAKINQTPLLMLNNSASLRNVLKILKVYNEFVDYQISIGCLRNSSRQQREIREFPILEEYHWRDSGHPPMTMLLFGKRQRQAKETVPQKICPRCRSGGNRARKTKTPPYKCWKCKLEYY